MNAIVGLRETDAGGSSQDQNIDWVQVTVLNQAAASSRQALGKAERTVKVTQGNQGGGEGRAQDEVHTLKESLTEGSTPRNRGQWARGPGSHLHSGFVAQDHA